MKTRSYAVPLAVLLAVPLLGVVAPRADAAQTCAGREATIVGSGQRLLQGTAGPDVIVTEGAATVTSYAGADVVCVTGPVGATEVVDAGAGDDEVLGADGDLVVYTGPGADAFTGGAGDDHVDADDTDVDERDVIHTGAGDDEVESGVYEVELRDDVDLGPGDDVVDLAGRVLGAGGRLVGGAGSDELRLLYTDKYLDTTNEDPDAELDWQVTNTTTVGTARAGGLQKLAWTGFELFSLSTVARSYSFVGGPGDESVSANPLRSATMGAGDDSVSFTRWPSGGVDGGARHDVLSSGYCAHAVTADLRTRRYRCGGRTRAMPGFEDLELVGRTVDVRGSARAEEVAVQACRGVVHGLGGADTLRVVDRDTYFLRYLGLCGRGDVRPVRLFGDAGDDVLRGSRARDLLHGGAGRDRADGRGGRDACRAERRTACER